MAIAACTRLITSGRYNGPDLAITYTNRGDAWRVKGDANRAIADYDQAIGIDPQYATAYTKTSGLPMKGKKAVPSTLKVKPVEHLRLNLTTSA